MDIEPSTSFNYYCDVEEDTPSHVSLGDSKIEQNSNFQNNNNVSTNDSDSSVAFETFLDEDKISGFEPVLGGQLREKAIWVDEATCIGCQYCVHVANNTFIVDETLGRSRVIRQNGDNLEIVQEAIDTCPVDCIHWVDFEDLER